MAAEVLDYYPLLPGELGKQLTDATTAWRSASTSQDAILLPLFTGVKGFEIDVFAVRNNVNTIGRIPIPLCRDIISYAQIFTSIVSVIKDPSTLATSLRILVDQWHQLNTNELASLGDQVTRLLQYDAPKVKSIISELKTLSEVIATWTPDSTDGVFDSSLFDAATPILAPIANFLPTADGITSFADATGLSIQAINIPLKKAFQKPVVGEPIATPDAVFKAIDAALVGRTKKYFGHVNHVVRDVNALVEHLEAVASAALLIPEGLDAFATGQSGSDPVTAEDTVKAWNEASTAADEFVSAIIGRAKSVISEDTPPTSADIEQALGPPSYSASTLFILADQTRKVTDQLRTALALPYNQLVNYLFLRITQMILFQ
ncbi:hypothetical protein GYMLUDRAFT_753215 [Collybiopsis luxurians FD-317 M1]|uniref:Uncharacterized protein n=1 Tax=Collybiopsis luxurians FD-317 M1 TaxID=944289 RepID=A0A0D0BQW9_9AGAR|nr:hypothetical protein GYMLUDRAFT_753215 [Collybiopsis luxurians FD-317 M1]